MRSRIDPIKKFARTLRRHEPELLNFNVKLLESVIRRLVNVREYPSACSATSATSATSAVSQSRCID